MSEYCLFLSNPPSLSPKLYQLCCDGTHSLACMTGFQFQIWAVIVVGGTFVPIVKWNKEAWGWNIRQLSMLTARSQQGVHPAIHPAIHPPLVFYSGPQKLQKTPQTIELVEPHPLGNRVFEAAPSGRRRSSLSLAFVVNTWWDEMLWPPTSSHRIQFNCTLHQHWTAHNASGNNSNLWNKPPRHPWTITYCSWNSLVTFCDPLSERSSLVHCE